MCKISKIQYRGNRNLKKSKIEISRQWFDRSSRKLAWWCSSTSLTVLTVKNLKFRKFKMTATAIFKIRKLIYRCRGLSDFDEIWHRDAVRPSW